MRAALRTTLCVFLLSSLPVATASLLAGCNKRGSQAAATKWTCPMHPEVLFNQEGRCPKCRMDLVPAKDEPKTDTENKRGPQAAAAKWTCPMHPEVVSNQEGRCPKCRMDLVPAKDEPKTDAASDAGTPPK